MDVFLIVLLLVLLLVYLRRYLLYRNFVKNLAESLEAKQRYLSAKGPILLGSKHVLRLTNIINRMIEENSQLRQSRASHLEQLEAILANMLEGALILDERNRIILANNALRNSFSNWIKDSEIEGQRLEVLFTSSDLLTTVNLIKRGEAPQSSEIELMQADESRWVRVSGAYLGKDNPESDDLTLLIFFEITRQKELESASREFVANVSHELRTPLTIIKGYVDTLNQDFELMPDGRKLKFIKKLRKNVERMYNLLMDLFSLTKIESTETAHNWTKVHLNTLVREVLANLTDRLEGHGMTLNLELPDSEIEVWADESKLGQVLENLVDNAIKYTPENSTLVIGTRRDNREATVWVEDNGFGIPQTDLPRIFERFYRVDKGRSREKGGTGLGLSIVKRIIDLHRGSVMGENVEGGGLRITFKLPLR